MGDDTLIIDKIIGMGHHLTPRETLLKGGSVSPADTTTLESWLRPVGKRLGYADEQIRQAREKQPVILSPLVLGAALTVNGQVGFRLGQQDENGLVLVYPPIIEADIDKRGNIIVVRDREDLIPNWIEYLKEKGLDLNLQPVKDIGEGPQPRSGELR